MTEQTRITALVRDAYDKSADRYESAGRMLFHPLGTMVADLLDLRPGERVLDLGCGRGACLFPIAHQVGAEGFVLGIDQARGMVDACAADVETRGLRGRARVEVGDAQNFTVDRPFDAVSAGMVLFLLPAPEQALACAAAALRPGGRLAATTFPTEHGRLAAGWESAETLAGVLAGYLPDGVDDPWQLVLGLGGPLASEETTANAVLAAGFRDVDVHHVPARSRFETIDDYLSWTWTVTTRMQWDLVPPERVAEATDAAREALRSLAGADGSLELSCPTRTIRAVR
ncbi:methyltransferase domain-containing protein [Micromonospora sp. WMMA1363]|uniref:methyltransferase domain-containing protein n=1 Tax=Micromonospora sp. WMMA1363 TaxID=3053985 RepID=UPI00259D11C8|nr:methyltransferase domain-containing protein [Micromonospora sp. WMMA1363]MDM4719459.1 methyltransferase domain-containing protein [Micromonospora sp. WMMA1363]